MLTNSTTDVTNFGIGSSGALVYEAKKQYSLARSEHLSRSGYTITSPDALSLLVGAVDGVTAPDVRWGIGEQVVQIICAHGAPTRKLEVTGGGENTYFLNYPAIRPGISSAGTLAPISGTPGDGKARK